MFIKPSQSTGLLARKAVRLGLSVPPFVKTSLSPGSGVVTYYLNESGVIEDLKALGFADFEEYLEHVDCSTIIEWFNDGGD